mmetsp:Transcript_38022/g.90327  ORF Transcript_38022/g.90327 Transcript_38022/m.90327 type:complete len:398 (+) Transcript_38022:1835-3028(+)
MGAGRRARSATPPIARAAGLRVPRREPGAARGPRPSGQPAAPALLAGTRRAARRALGAGAPPSPPLPAPRSNAPPRGEIGPLRRGLHPQLPRPARRREGSARRTARTAPPRPSLRTGRRGSRTAWGWPGNRQAEAEAAGTAAALGRRATRSETSLSRLTHAAGCDALPLGAPPPEGRRRRRSLPPGPVAGRASRLGSARGGFLVRPSRSSGPADGRCNGHSSSPALRAHGLPPSRRGTSLPSGQALPRPGRRSRPGSSPRGPDRAGLGADPMLGCAASGRAAPSAEGRGDCRRRPRGETGAVPPPRLGPAGAEPRRAGPEAARGRKEGSSPTVTAAKGRRRGRSDGVGGVLLGLRAGQALAPFCLGRRRVGPLRPQRQLSPPPFPPPRGCRHRFPRC